MGSCAEEGQIGKNQGTPAGYKLEETPQQDTHGLIMVSDDVTSNALCGPRKCVKNVMQRLGIFRRESEHVMA